MRQKKDLGKMCLYLLKSFLCTGGLSLESLEEKKSYNAKEIMKILGVGKTATYRLIEESLKYNTNFIVKKVGDRYVVNKDSFDNWFNS